MGSDSRPLNLAFSQSYTVIPFSIYLISFRFFEYLHIRTHMEQFWDNNLIHRFKLPY